MLPPGKNSGRTTNESVENASRRAAERSSDGGVAELRRAPRRRTPAGTRARPARPTARRRRRGPSRSSGCRAAAAGRSSPRSSEPRVMAMLSQRRPPPAHLERGPRGRDDPPVEVVRRARALAGDHRRAERVARRAQRAERLALVRLDQPLQHLAAAAHRGLLGVDAADGEPVLGVVRRGTSPTAASRSAGSSRCRARRGRRPRRRPRASPSRPGCPRRATARG